MPETCAAVLETPRLLLRPMLATDLDDLLAIFTDPRVMAAFDCAPFSREQMRRWLQRNLEHQERHGYGLFAVLLKGEGLLVGDCGLEVAEEGEPPTVELGYDFRSDYWHRGLATEAATAVRDWAFTSLALPCLVSFIRVGNLPSQRVAERLGMSRKREFSRYGYQYWEYAVEREGLTPVASGSPAARHPG